MARKYLFLTTAVSVVVALGLFILLMVSYHRIQSLEAGLKDQETRIAREHNVPQQVMQLAGPGVATSPVDQQIKDLSTRFVGDPRTLAEKLNDFLGANAGAQPVAIASKVIAELAENRDALGDGELRWLYEVQDNPDIKRVVAQVLSLRGDNQLIDAYIATFQPALASPSATERRAALALLGKTRYAGAAKIIVPLLSDADLTVVLDALLALRITGNETQLPALKELLNHSDESVRWLASDAANNLELLSKKARMHVNTADIVAELSPIVME